MNEDIKFYERKRWVFLGLPFTFTKYKITEDLVTIDEGLFKVTENDCYMYKIQDVKLTATLFERMFGLGTIECFTGDSTHQQLFLSHIKNSKEIKSYLLKASEEARIKRRTINTLDIGVEDELDQ